MSKLTGAPVEITDLRAGAALAVAALAAEGTTELYGVEVLDRGYEGFEAKLRGLGARVVREETLEGIDLFAAGSPLQA